MELVMTSSDEGNPPDFADEDQTLVGDIADLYRVIDPIPFTLVERLQFALALESADFEILRPHEERALSTGVRGGQDSRTITFDGEIITIMISVSVRDEYSVRVDGWLAPPGEHLVEMRTAEGPHEVRADDQGRFVIGAVPRGLTQLVVKQGLDDDGQATILAVTPSLIL
jgi:hypothetical protein